MKAEWGIDQFIPLRDFNLASKGYLVDDTCAFGAEVFVCKERSTGKGECLVMMKEAILYKHLYEFDNLSKLDLECYDSKPFNAGNFKWYKWLTLRCFQTWWMCFFFFNRKILVVSIC